ncbi:glycosyltransferase family 2 protein [Acinetobacter sp.]|uniref:glycosyltransferase family 2 protein n=1 Tax=Acinetobacter sp. TaxID=472 RepID=UPI00388EF61C
MKCKIVAIVAAYNEGPRIRHVIEVLSSYLKFDEIVIVDDGSTDGTFLEALRSRPTDPLHNITILTQLKNEGKGQAMDRGVQESDADIIFFADADIQGLRHEHIDEILNPVLQEKTSMMIAMRNRAIYTLPFVLKIIALLGGERALTRELWEAVPKKFKDGFMIETALNYYAGGNGGYEYSTFDIQQTIKEKKHGIARGFLSRVKMFFTILKTHILLRLK